MIFGVCSSCISISSLSSAHPLSQPATSGKNWLSYLSSLKLHNRKCHFILRKLTLARSSQDLTQIFSQKIFSVDSRSTKSCTMCSYRCKLSVTTWLPYVGAQTGHVYLISYHWLSKSKAISTSYFQLMPWPCIATQYTSLQDIDKCKFFFYSFFSVVQWTFEFYIHTALIVLLNFQDSSKEKVKIQQCLRFALDRRIKHLHKSFSMNEMACFVRHSLSGLSLQRIRK